MSAVAGRRPQRPGRLGHVARAARDRGRIAVGRRHGRRAGAHQVAGQVPAAGVELEHDARRRADRFHHGRDQRRVAGAPDLREAVRRNAQRRRSRLRDVDVGPPERRLSRQRQPDDARRAQTIDLAPRVRRAGRVGLGDVDVHAVVARLRVDLDAGRQPARGRAQRRQRARQLGAEQRTRGDVDEVVRPPRAETRASRPARPPAWRDRDSRTAGWRRRPARQRHAQRALDDRALGRVLRRRRHVLPLAAAAGAEQRTRRRHPIRARAARSPTSSPQATFPFSRSMRDAHALARRRQRHERDAPVVGRRARPPRPAAARRRRRRRQRLDLDADLIVRHVDGGYGNGLRDAPALRDRSRSCR